MYVRRFADFADGENKLFGNMILQRNSLLVIVQAVTNITLRLENDSNSPDSPMRIVQILSVVVLSILLNRNPVSAQVTYSKVVLSTEDAPGVGAGVTYLSVSGLSASASSQVVVSGLISGPGVTTNNDTGLWAGAPGSQALLAREGDSAPGTGGATFLVLAPFTGTNINGTGQVAFSGFLTGTGITSGVNDRGFWSGAPGSVGLLARIGDNAPGAGTGVVFSSFVFPSITFNSAGQAAFIGTVSGTGVTLNNDTGIWVGAPGSVSLAVREGDAAPDTELNTVFSGFSNHRLNASGQLAFNATVTGPISTGGTGIWAGTPGSMNLVARANAAAPGTVAGVNFDSFGSPAFNAAGHVAFAAGLGGIITANNNSGIWARTGGPRRPEVRGLILWRNLGAHGRTLDISHSRGRYSAGCRSRRCLPQFDRQRISKSHNECEW